MQARLAELQARFAELQTRLTELEQQLAQARKNSSTSSKPPSSDIVKPPKPAAAGQAKRRRGGQPGHPRYDRLAFPPEVVHVHEHRLDCCPDCGQALAEAQTAAHILQQVEIPQQPLRLDEHRGLASWCPQCRQVHYAPLPRRSSGRRLAGAAVDGSGGLSQGGLPRFLLHRSASSCVTWPG